MKKHSKIKILFDAGPLVNGPKSGVGYYTWGLIENLAKDYPDDIELVGHYFDFLGRKRDIALPTAPNIRYRTTRLLPGKILNMLRRLHVWIPFELLIKEKGDLLLFPAFIGWPSLFKSPIAPMIHDVTFIDYPEYVNAVARHDLQKMVHGTVKNAAFIITNSYASEASLRREFDMDNKPVVVGHIPPVNAISINESKAQDCLKNLGINKKFILFLGNLEPRKNLTSLLQAFTRLDDKLANQYQLVLAGGKGWNNEEIHKAIEEARAHGRDVILPGYVSEEERAVLFSFATAFTLVSLYEGFGMPLLEGMTYKTPLLVSGIPAHREVGEDAALYCDPKDIDDITQKLATILQDKQLRSTLVTRGTKRLKAFSWHTVTKDVYSEIRKAVS